MKSNGCASDGVSNLWAVLKNVNADGVLHVAI